MTLEGKDAELDLEVACAEASGGWGVTCRASATDAGGTRHDETHLWGYSRDTARVHLFTVTSDGDTHDHAGSFTDRGIKLEYAGSTQGQPLIELLTFENTSPSTMRFRNDTTVGGQPLLAVDMTLRKNGERR